jgi:N-acylneuraminate cytidylyltransferase/CMP-N,N'-diacetyllegionaminic acid synthase
VGVISDGDIRRALVGKALLVATVGSHMNLDPATAQTIEDGKKLLKNHNLLAVPVLDLEGEIACAAVQGIDDIEVIRKESSVFSGDIANDQVVDTIVIIPARGGSKRIPKKNMALIAGKPLLSYAIATAQNARFVSRVIVSTDDPEIAEIARKYGAEVPWIRPAYLAQDNTPAIDVVIHAVEWARLQYGQNLQYGILLEPTAPLRTALHIEQAMDLLKKSNADSVVSVCKAPHIFNPEELLVIQDEGLRPYKQDVTMDTRLLRGQQSPVYFQNGLVYAFRIEMLLKRKSLYGEKALPLITEWEYFLDIDVPSDLAFAEYKIGLIKNSYRSSK